MFDFLMFVAVLVLFVMLLDMRGRLKIVENTLKEAAKRIGALQRQTGLLPPKPGETFASVAPAQSAPEAPPAASDEEALRERWRPKDAPPPATSPATKQATEQYEADAPRQEPLRTAAFAVSPPPARASESTAESPVADPVHASAAAPVPAEAAVAAPADSPPTPKDLKVAAVQGAAPQPPAPPPPPAAPPPPPAVPPEPPASLASRFENLFGKTLPIWAGGITLAIAGVLIVRYAIDAGFFARIFTRGVQVVAGGLFGLGLIGGAELAWRNEDRVRDTRVPQALSGAGIASLYAAILVAANAYQLIAPWTAFLLLAAVTAGALGLSLRFGAPSALLGLAGGLAAPALVGSVEPNVPLLAVYLGLTITGLTGVARMRRWPWLAVAALAGGAGWSLWMVAAGNALDTLGTLSVGGFVLLLAIALPLFAFDGPRAWLLRTASALVGAVQLALLVALGGFASLDWGLFALLAAAGQWLAWRERDFVIVPTISVVLSVLLLAIWPQPDIGWFALIGAALAAIHAAPLLARLTSLQRALELCGVALAAPLLTAWHYPSLDDLMLALVAAGGAAIASGGVVRLWSLDERGGDARLAWLASVAAGLAALALAKAGPDWAIPLAVGAMTAALFAFGRKAADRRIEPVAVGFGVATLASLIITPFAPAEAPRLLLGGDSALQFQSLARLGGMTALMAFFAVRAERDWLRLAAVLLSGSFAYAMLAQLAPGWSLPLAMGAVALALFALGQRRAMPVMETVGGGFAAIAVLLLAVTGPQPFGEWSRLVSSDNPVDFTALLRWGGLTVLFAFLAWRSGGIAMRLLAHLGAALLAHGLLAQLLPGWSLPLALVAVTLIMAAVGERGHTVGVATLAVVLALACLPLLLISAEDAAAEVSRLWGSDARVGITSLVRWGGVAGLAALYAVRARGEGLQLGAQIVAALLGYGMLAQIVPGSLLMVVPAIGAAATLMGMSRFGVARLAYAGGTLTALVAAWATLPLAHWLVAAVPSLIAIPMQVDAAALAPDGVFLRLLLPALLVGGALWMRRDLVPGRVLQAMSIGLGLLATIAGHILYRHGFAALFGEDFVVTGLAQRLLWDALLIGGGMALAQRSLAMNARPLLWAGTAHLFWYSLVLHNPLWSAQAVCAIPLLNLLLPLFALAWLGLQESAGPRGDRRPAIARSAELLTMVLIAGFAWATLRQLFHGTLLTAPGVTSVENILRSILILGLAIGYLLWGIRSRRHDWRIASLVLMLAAVAKVFLFDASGLEGLLRIGSFVALGFSLIGIGWLYSRQLQRSDALRATEGS